MIKVAGTGSYLPEKIMTNFDLEKIVDTNDAWIRQRTGIKERRIANEDQVTSDIAVKASANALEEAGLKSEDLELIVLSTSTPDYHVPACAPIIQDKLGCRKIPAFDVNSVCTGFMYSFLTAYGLLASGLYHNCLVIGADTYSRILNWKDRNTCVIFGDGAGAVILKRDPDHKGVLSSIFGADGSGSNLITIPVGGSKNPLIKDNQYNEEDFHFQMTGKKVYEFTISVIPKVAQQLLIDAGLDSDSIDWIILHQANYRIIETISKYLKIDINKFIITIERFGNTSSASIPIALDQAVIESKINEGDKVMMIGFGGGLSWGGTIIEW